MSKKTIDSWDLITRGVKQERKTGKLMGSYLEPQLDIERNKAE